MILWLLLSGLVIMAALLLNQADNKTYQVCMVPAAARQVAGGDHATVRATLISLHEIPMGPCNLQCKPARIGLCEG